MQITYALKPKQKAAELILPTEHPLNRIESLFEYGSVEERLAASLGDFSTTRIGVNVRYHAAIENGFAVLPAIIDAIQADNGSLEVKANRMGDAYHLRKATILSPFIFLWPLNPMLSPPFFAAVVVPSP